MTVDASSHVTAQPLCISLPISFLVVIEMKRIVPYKKVSLKSRVLRIMGTGRSFEEPPSYQEITHIPIPTGTDYSYHKDIKAALLEAERKKAQALIEWQRHRMI
jgi:hypothetical protein